VKVVARKLIVQNDFVTAPVKKINNVTTGIVSQTLISNSDVMNNSTSVSKKKKEKKEQLTKSQKRKLIGKTG